MQVPAHSILQRTLYDPWFEHDGCGIGFVARISGQPAHDILQMALTAVGNLEHRGAVADDARTGDGAGVLTQIPRPLLMRELERQGIQVDAADLAVGMLFLPQDAAAATASCRIITQALTERELAVLAWRDLPIHEEALGQRARAVMPCFRQVIIGRGAGITDQEYERRLFLARKAMEVAFQEQNLATYIPSLSSRTIVYKGLMLGSCLSSFFCDLQDPDYTTSIAVYHQRYSTNTFPTWDRAQPFRMLSHNGEINTLQGNVNWMRAREQMLNFPVLTGAGSGEPVAPVIDANGSDSAMLDNALELLVLGGRDIRHAMTMMVPEAWEKFPDIDPALRAFYQYHACLMEPWDGPAALTFCDGQVVGTALDRNGLRPNRYLVTSDGLVFSGSEVGAIPIPEERIVHKGKLGPGQIIAVDTEAGHFYTNEEIKDMLAEQQPYDLWVAQHFTPIETLMEDVAPNLNSSSNGQLSADPDRGAQPELEARQMAFGYTSEDLNVILKPMLRNGQEPVGSMGDDTPAAVLSQYELGRPLFQFFKQRFAEVTNPPIDPLREELVMSLHLALGRRQGLLDETPEQAHLLGLSSPVLTDAYLAAIRTNADPLLRTATINALVPVAALEEEPDQALQAAVSRLCADAEAAARAGTAILVISDRDVDADQAAIPALLALGTVHHHLIRTGWRSHLSLVVESGEPREVHHLACLVGYGAEAVNPYLALESVRALKLVEISAKQGNTNGNGNGNGATDLEHGTVVVPHATELAEAEAKFIQALEKGLFKIMSKMGISPVQSYCGAQIFEAVGLSQELIDACFTNTPSRIGGIGFAKLAQDVLVRHQRAFGGEAPKLPHPGFYKFKKGGEYHAYSPAVVHALHKAVQSEDALNGDSHSALRGYGRYRAYADLVNNRPPTEPRDLLEFVPAGSPIPLEEVEPIEAIVKRFSTAAMSHGSTSSEAHETLSIAMNRLGGKSNSGEGGEAPERYKDERNSRIKQVASGRFGVTPAYLASAEELQIKMAQGSKPGEGGHLPGHKVSAEIARIRHTVPGVSLISPPPHHDIYSIEDLAQLIYDLKQVNTEARVSVKLVATAGVGTIAAGVAKGYADGILISGHSGGTGASPLSSIKNAGISWELGLAETQQTLVLNGLRGRVRLRADGGFRTGRDVVLAALLGADEFSFGTSALIAEGCVMARACHNNTCPVGIATQRGDLRAKFPGKPEMVMAFFRYMAQEIREILASLGLRSLEEAVGRTDLLCQRQSGVPSADLLDLTPVLAAGSYGPTDAIRHSGQDNALPAQETLNARLLHDARGVFSGRGPVELTYTIGNGDRTFGARLAGTIGQMFGENGLPPNTVNVTLQGSAGQSFGAFNAPGMHLTLIGEANDYVGKGMAGGVIVVRPNEKARYAWQENVIAGNTLLYGATGGELYAAGQVGERFAVRNSGSTAVVEGVGDHGCEYMTGGTVVVLGQTGRNFGAGMTGGVAYVLDETGMLEQRYNPTLVQIDPLNPQDEARVQQLIRRHIELTNSRRAAEILARWEVYRAHFCRVMPREVVAKLEAATEGLPEPAVPRPRSRHETVTA
jgi:glutamate synthase (ferredoxin)